jgi:hypothetical protein
MIAKFQKLILIISMCSAASTVFAGGSAEASAQALNNSFEAIGYSVEGGLKLASGAAAIPFMVVGEIGNVSGEVGHGLWDEANSPPSGPLPVTDEIVTVGPNPAEQLGN